MEEVLADQQVQGDLLMNFRQTMLKTPRDRRTIGWFKTQLEQLETQWDEFQKGHKNICKTDIMDALSPGRSQTSLQTDAQYREIRINTLRYKAPLSTIDLPQFSGDQLEWETFKGMFLQILKLQYLIRSLTGEVANRLKNVQITADNYDGAWQAILDRYDNKRVLLATHMSHVISCPAMQKKSIEELRRVLDVIRESKQALDNLKIDPEHMGELWLIHHTVNKLDQATRLDWERQVDETDGFPKYAQLAEFLERSIRVSEAASTTSSGSGSYNSNVNNKFPKSARSRHNKQIAVHTTSAQAAGKPGARACVLCRGGHALYSCHKFAALSQPQRFELCKKEKLCLNCLSGSHYAGDCRSERRCLVCQGRHHTKLHADSQSHRNSASIEDGGSSARQDADAGEDGSATCYFTQQKLKSPKVLLATAQIVLADESGNQVQVRAMIDPGTERSFVTERVLTALCVSSSKVHINLYAMGDQCSSTVQKQTQLFLRSKIDVNFSLRAKSLVMRELTGLLPTARLPEDHWPHLRGIVFADPTYYKPDKVEFVIGAELIPFIMLEGLRKGSIGSPLGQQTVFGWILTGEIIPKPDDSPAAVSAFHVCAREDLHGLVEKFWQLEDLQPTKHLTAEEQYCENYFTETTTRNADGRYVVRLPFAKKVSFEGSRDVAVSCLHRMERRLEKSPRLSMLYKNFMDEYIYLKHMELVPESQLSHSGHSVNVLQI
uniref:Peptidase aspartic putative domain-containing protein n=1 Tax=Trichogramma kaykai TaxID=54128 RepID=A0ABD2W317_9HYME